MKEADSREEAGCCLPLQSSYLGWMAETLSAILLACVLRCAVWLFCLLFAYAREGSLDSLVADTLCLDLDLLGSIFVPEGINNPGDFSLLPPSPSHPTKGIAVFFCLC